MTQEPTLTESAIRRLTTAQSFSRGEDYYYSDVVTEVVRRGDMLTAEVEGSSYEPYQVTVTLDEGGIVDLECTCPYDWGGYCKHIVAVLLTYVRDPDQVAERPPVESLLANLDRETLLELLLDLLAERPHLVDWIEGRVAAQQARETVEEPRQRRTDLDPQTFRRQVTAILHSLDRMRASEAYWHVGGVVGSLRGVLDQARTFIEGGDGRNALVILGALADELIEGWLYLDDSDGYMGEFWDELGGPFAEAILSADLSEAERREWADRLTAWQSELTDYGIETFEIAIGACEQGWEYGPLQRAMRGDFDHRGAWEDEAPWYAGDLAVARLNVLERQRRFEEYLYLAEAEGQTARHLTMLVKLGRYDEALDYGLKYLGATEDALAVAQALRENGQPQAALRIAEHGLGLEGPKAALAAWLRDLAGAMGERDLALVAAQTAFKERSSLENYQAVHDLAGQAWPGVRDDLLAILREGKFPGQDHVDIYLHEGMLDEAIKVADGHSYYRLVEQVVDAAWERRPAWAIRACKQQAEPIIERGQSDRYHHAARWLEKARDAAQAGGTMDEYRAYIRDIIARHSRKYKLVPMLEELLE